MALIGFALVLAGVVTFSMVFTLREARGAITDRVFILFEMPRAPSGMDIF
jgi:hypothetical protein